MKESEKGEKGAGSKHAEVRTSSYRKPKTMGKFVVEEETKACVYSLRKRGEEKWKFE